MVFLQDCCSWVSLLEKRVGSVPLVAERRSGLLMVFVFQRREQRLEQMRGKGGGCVLVCWLLRGRRKSKWGGAASLCKQGKGGLRPPLLSLFFPTGRRGRLREKRWV
jgi:hypothetical protein